MNDAFVIQMLLSYRCPKLPKSCICSVLVEEAFGDHDYFCSITGEAQTGLVLKHHVSDTLRI